MVNHRAPASSLPYDPRMVILCTYSFWGDVSDAKAGDGFDVFIEGSVLASSSSSESGNVAGYSSLYHVDHLERVKLEDFRR